MSNTETAPERGSRTADAGASSSPSDSASERTVAPGDVVGRYQVRGLLGTGGMGQVFDAFDPQLGRTVALKLIRPDGLARSSRARGRARLLREAQALARLQHPGVVAIHDVGTQGDQVFIAMELVAGQTLRDWLHGSPRSWRAIRDVFIAAGRGLCAAHAAGIVHRDFKPSNVIVGNDRVVVVDFGLARARGDERGADDSRSDSSTVLDVDLTLTGEAVGTPRYMAPEQRAGGPVAEQSDQFAFAVALWEALYGKAPSAGDSAAPAPTDVPDRVRAALARALAPRPADRWPRLDDLLDALGHDPSAARRRFLTILALSVAAIAGPVAYLVGRASPESTCAASLAGLWDGRTRAEVRAAFVATGKPFAGDSFEIVDAALRVRLGAWERAHEEACAATEIRHEQSAALMDARMGCLARARDQIAAFIDVLRSADGGAVATATTAAAGIGDLESCANAPALTAAVPPPSDPARAAAVEELAHAASQVEALMRVGRVHEAADAGGPLLARARALGHPPLLARVLYDVGGNACLTGDPREAEAMQYEAARAAAAAHDDVLAVRVLSDLIWCVGTRAMNVHGARALAEMAEVALARAGSPPEERARLYRAQAFLRQQSGDMVNAFAFAELELMTHARLRHEEGMDYALALADVGDAQALLGAYRGAMATYGRALPLLERTLGPSHPGTAVYLVNLGSAATEAGDLDAAATALERGLDIEEKVYGPSRAPVLGASLRNLAWLRRQQGETAVARELLLRVRASEEAAGRADHPAATATMRDLAAVELDGGRLDAAQALAARARAVSVETFGAEHPEVAEADVLLAEVARRRHDPAEARRLLEGALAVHRSAYGDRHPRVASDRTELARLLLATGQPAAAAPLLEDALAVQERTRDGLADEIVTGRALYAEALLAQGERDRALEQARRAVAASGARRRRPEIDAHARFAMAEALDASDRPRAIELAVEARDRLRAAPRSDETARIERWLARRAPRGPHQ